MAPLPNRLPTMKTLFATISLFIAFCSLHGTECNQSEGKDLLSKRIRSHLVLFDPKSALAEVNQALTCCHNDEALKLELLRFKIRCHARLGDEKAMLQALNEYSILFPAAREDPVLLEEIAWATIKKGALDSSPLIRSEATLAAFYSQAAQGVPILQGMLCDQNIQIRLFALFLASHLRDEVLEQKVLQMLINDTTPYVRSACIETLGKMRSKKAVIHFRKLLADESTTHTDTYAIIQALSQVILHTTRENLTTLVKSPHSSLRALACGLVFHQDMPASDLIVELIKDSSIDVKMLALQTLGAIKQERLLEDEKLKNYVVSLLQETSPYISINAAFLILTSSHHQTSVHALGKATLEKWLSNKNQQYARLAAASVAYSGKAGIVLSEKWIDASSDHYVKLNLALHLIKQRKSTDKAAKILEECLSSVKERIDYRQDGLFTSIAPSQEVHQASHFRYPETKDLACRLDLYGCLATCNFPELQEKIASFLKGKDADKSWGITGMTALLLIQEKDDAAFDVLEKLLDDESLEVRLQAAFILASCRQDEKSLNILQESFLKAKRELKELILVGIGAIGSKTSLPFLTQALDEPSQVLRLRAASSILQCLYH